MPEIFDKTFKGLEKSLELRLRRHMLLTSNVANSETPKFRARELDFSGALERAMGSERSEMVKTNPLHMDMVEDTAPRVVFDDRGAVKSDGNNVDLDLAMGKMSENSRAYNNAVTVLDLKLRFIKMLVNQRGGA